MNKPGRKPLVEGVRRDQLPPSQRGGDTAGDTVAVTIADKARLKRLAGEKGSTVKAFMTVVLDHFEGTQGNQAPASAPALTVPWDAIREAFLDEFGFIEHVRIDRALQKVTEALPK